MGNAQSGPIIRAVSSKMVCFIITLLEAVPGVPARAGWQRALTVTIPTGRSFSGGMIRYLYEKLAQGTFTGVPISCSNKSAVHDWARTSKSMDAATCSPSILPHTEDEVALF